MRRVTKKRAQRQDEAKQQRSQKLGVVASRSRRQAEMKQQRTAAAVVATVTRSRCKGEPTHRETAQTQEQIQYKPELPFNLRARKNIIARKLHAEYLVWSILPMGAQ